MSIRAGLPVLDRWEPVSGTAAAPPTLRLLAVAITATCNQNCGFCSRRASARDRTYLSPELYAAAIADVRVMGGLETLVVTGGEPFLHPGFAEILALSAPPAAAPAAARPWTLKLNTNGTLLNERRLALLSGARVRGVTVSLEGDHAALHDGVREDPGSFNRTVHGITQLVGAGFDVHVNTNLVPANLATIERTVVLAHRLGALGMNISRIYPVGRGREHIRDYYIAHDDFRAAIRRCLAAKPFGFDLRFEDQALRHLLDPRYAGLDGLGWCRHGSKTAVGCFAGVSMLHVNPNGDVLACTMLERPVGNLHAERLERIWNSSSVLARLRDRGRLGGACGSCEAKDTCGGCRGRAYGLLGDEMAEDPYCPKSTTPQAQWLG